MRTPDQNLRMDAIEPFRLVALREGASIPLRTPASPCLSGSGRGCGAIGRRGMTCMFRARFANAKPGAGEGNTLWTR